MANSYNEKLLSILNKVREGETKPFTINYRISNNFVKKELKNSIVNSSLTDSELRKDVYSAFDFWRHTFNVLYSPNKKIKGALQMNIVEKSNENTDLNINIKKSFSKDPIQIKGNTIFLSTKFRWKCLKYNSGLDIYSHIIYGIGKILGLNDSIQRTSIMNRGHLKVNYKPFYELRVKKDGFTPPSLSLLDRGTSKDILKIYGSLKYSYPIIYGCTDINAINFNSKATRHLNVCKYNIPRKQKLKSYK